MRAGGRPGGFAARHPVLVLSFGSLVTVGFSIIDGVRVLGAYRRDEDAFAPAVLAGLVLALACVTVIVVWPLRRPPSGGSGRSWTFSISLIWSLATVVAFGWVHPHRVHYNSESWALTTRLGVAVVTYLSVLCAALAVLVAQRAVLSARSGRTDAR